MTNAGSSFLAGGKYPLDRRYALATENFFDVYAGASKITGPTIRCGSLVVTSTGVTGPYAIPFTTAFPSVVLVNTVTLQTATAYFPGYTYSNLTTTGFDLFWGTPDNPAVAPGVGVVATCNYIAIGY